MSLTPIQFTNVSQRLPYCQPSDVLAIIGRVGSIADGTISTQQISTAINAASKFIDSSTQRFFSPRNIVSYVSGNSQNKLQLPLRPIMSLNSLSIYIAYPLAISMFCNDWNLRIDRGSGTLTFPTSQSIPVLAPFSNYFLEGQENIIVNATYGYSNIIYNEDITLSTKDNINYNLANPTGFVCAAVTNALNSSPPVMFPQVIVNGFPVVNTTYQFQTQAAIYTQNIWMIQSDNLVYTLKTGPKGITGIQFNSALPSGSIVQVSYPYWYIPADIIEITAKKACITLLSGVATDGGFSDTMYQGTVELMLDGSRSRYNDALGKFGHQMGLWQTEIAATIASYKKIQLPYGLSTSGLR